MKGGCMKYIKYFIIVLSVFMCINVLNAECDNAKQNGEYLWSVVDRATLKTDSTVVKLFLFTDEVYYEISNDYNDTVEKYTYADIDEDSIIKFNSPDILTNVKYTVKAYYTDNTCGTEPIKTFEVETGIYNKNSDNKECWDKLYLDVCKNNYSPDELKEYESITNDEELTKKIEEEDKVYNEETKKSVLDIVKEYYLYVLIPCVVISVFYIIRIIIIKKRKEVKDEK